MSVRQAGLADRQALLVALAKLPPPSTDDADALSAYVARRGSLLDEFTAMVAAGPPLSDAEKQHIARELSVSASVQARAEAHLATIREQLRGVNASLRRGHDAAPLGALLNRLA